ncbi:MAG: hypothetical protein ABI175_20105 [Polyangiales bacterium]
MDEGLLLSYPELVRRGAQPGIDFIYPYGPAGLQVLGLFYRLLGVSLTVERVVGLAYRLALIGALYAATRRTHNPAAIVGAIFAGWMIAPLGLGAFAWFGGIAALVASMALLVHAAPGRSSGRLVGAGVLLGIALDFRADLAIPVALVAVAGLRRRDTRAHLAFAGAAFVGALPLVRLALSIGVREMWRSMVREPAARAPAHLLPFPPRGPALLLFATVTFAAVLVAFGVPLVRALRARAVDDALAPQLMLGAVAVALLPQLVQRADVSHIICVAVVAVPAGLAQLATLARRPSRALLPHAFAAFVVFAGNPRTMFAPLVEASGVPVTVAGRTFLVDDPAHARELTEALGELETRAADGESLFVGASDPRFMHYNDCFIYALTPKLRAASYYVAVVPGTTVAAADVERADWLLLTTYYDTSFSAMEWTDERRAFVRAVEAHCLVGRHGKYDLWRRCSRGG